MTSWRKQAHVDHVKTPVIDADAGRHLGAQARQACSSAWQLWRARRMSAQNCQQHNDKRADHIATQHSDTDALFTRRTSASMAL